MILFYTLTSPLVDTYLFNSHTVAAWYARRGIARRKQVVISNGVDVQQFAIPIDRAAVRASIGMPPDAMVIGCVAKLRKEKGHRFLFAAMCNVLTTSPRAHLVLAGSGPLEAELRRQAIALNMTHNVHFLGDRTDIPALYQAFDILVLPTLFEGMSNTLLEAMAAGVPIVTTDIPENRELLPDETYGLLVQRKQPLPLANAIVQLLSEPERGHMMAENARKRVHERYAIERVIESLRAFYSGL